MRLLVSALLFFTASQSFAAEFLVKYSNAKSLGAIYEMAQTKAAGMDVREVHEAGSYAVVDIANDTKSMTLATLSANPGVEWITENAQVHAFEPIAGEKTLRDQWAIAKVHANEAWQRAGNSGSKNIIVAVIDTGMDMQHRNLSRNVVPGYDFFQNDEDPTDQVGQRNPGHGTHCSGIIGADGLVEGGTTGLAPNVSLMPIRFLGPSGNGDLNNGVKAIDYAIEHGAQVISASWGASIKEPQAKAIIEAVKRASDKGVIFVVAAANDGKNNDVVSVYPANANFENTITVAASDSSDGKPSWSNYGRASVHVASPGENIMSTLPGDKYGNLSGTSMATPLVAGLVALLKSQDPSLTGAQIRALLQTTGAPVKIDTACNCRVDAFAAMDTLLSKKMWMVPAAATLNGVGATQATSIMNGRGAFTYASSNPAVLTVDEHGVAHAVANGTATIAAVDGNGTQVLSSMYSVIGIKAPTTPSEPAPPSGRCPFRSVKTCERMCKIFPNLRFCKAD